MKTVVFVFFGIFFGINTFYSISNAQNINRSDSVEDETIYSTVTDITEQALANDQIIHPPGIIPTPTPSSTKPLPNASPSPGSSPGPIDPGGIIPPVDSPVGGTIGAIIDIGQRIWNFIVMNKPTADYQTLESAVVPAGVVSWTQLTGWNKAPVIKIYHVEFSTIFGKSAGGFDYRISYMYSGTLHGKGKFIGKLSFVPTNIQLHTDRSLKIRAELLEPMNFGTEKNPIAGTSIRVTWETPTTTRYEEKSAEYMIYGTGEIVDLSNGIQ